MNNKTFVNGALYLVLCVTAIQTRGFAAEDGFDASEIRQLRFISQAILKSRANEKKIIEAETRQEKQRLATVYDSVLELDKFIKNELSRAELVVHSSSVPTNARITLNGFNTGTVVPFKDSNVGQPVSKQKVQYSEVDKARRKKRIDQILSKITALRQQTQSELIPKWQFWREKTRQEESNEHMANVLLETEQELVTLSVADKPDIKAIEKMLKRLELKRPAFSLKDADPTMQTITKHKSRN